MLSSSFTAQGQILEEPVVLTPVVSTTPAIQYLVSETTVHPNKFSGHKRSYAFKSFELAVERVFTLMEGRYNSDNKKVIYIGSLLEGPAQSWFNSIQSGTSDESLKILNDIEAFWESMACHFAVRHSELQERLEFLDFAQGKWSVAEYAIRFRQLASTITFNDDSLRAIFIRNLNAKAKDTLKNQPDIPLTLDGVIARCVNLDNNFLGDSDRVVRTYSNRDSSWAGQYTQVAAVSSSNPPRSNLICNYCHEPGHIKKDCPILNGH